MPVLFAGMSYVPWESGDAMQLVIVIFVLCAVAGALVGAVHGGFLLRLLRPDTTPASSECAAVPGNNAKR